MDIQRNTEERSCNHNCCGKAISIVHSRGGVRSGAIVYGTALQAGRPRIRFQMGS